MAPLARRPIPPRSTAPSSRAADIPTVGKLIDHIFLVERRHLQRLGGQPLSDSTGLTGNNAAPLFDYGASVRREMEQFVRELGDDEADEPRTHRGARPASGHDTAQAALPHAPARASATGRRSRSRSAWPDFEPPGDHDLFYSSALK